MPSSVLGSSIGRNLEVRERGGEARAGGEARVGGEGEGVEERGREDRMGGGRKQGNFSVQGAHEGRKSLP